MLKTFNTNMRKKPLFNNFERQHWFMFALPYEGFAYSHNTIAHCFCLKMDGFLPQLLKSIITKNETPVP